MTAMSINDKTDNTWTMHSLNVHSRTLLNTSGLTLERHSVPDDKL